MTTPTTSGFYFELKPCKEACNSVFLPYDPILVEQPSSDVAQKFLVAFNEEEEGLKEAKLSPGSPRKRLASSLRSSDERFLCTSPHSRSSFWSSGESSGCGTPTDVSSSSSSSSSFRSSEPSCFGLSRSSGGTIHAGANIRDKAWRRFVRDFLAVIDAGNKPTTERGELYQGFDIAMANIRIIAESYAVTMIDEASLDESLRSLDYQKSEDDNGKAGGGKVHCFDCIRLKCPWKNKNRHFYDGMYYKAQKTAKHELQYTDLFYSRLFEVQTKDGILIIPPPCLVIDYLGYRVLASVHLPLKKPRIIGATTNRKSLPLWDSQLSPIINNLLQPLGLAAHGLEDRDAPKKSEKEAHAEKDLAMAAEQETGRLIEEVDNCESEKSHDSALPFDAEVYQSQNSENDDSAMYYIVDLARMMPPGCDAERNIHNRDAQKDFLYLYQHMRGEFVKRYAWKRRTKKGDPSFPGLSSDALSNWSLLQDDEFQKEAYKYYCSHIPVKVKNHLEELDCSIFSGELVRIVHYWGLNLRDLGKVYLDMQYDKKCEKWCRRIEVEIAARCFRRVAENVLRDCCQKGYALSTIKEKVAILFNLVLGCNKNDVKQSELMWKRINEWKDVCFPGVEELVLKRECVVDEKYSFLLSSFIWISSDLLGISWVPSLWKKRKDVKYFCNENTRPFNELLIEDLRPRVLELNMAHHSHGRALENTSSVSDLKEAIRSFEKALDRQPSNEHTMDWLSRMMSKRADLLEERVKEMDPEKEKDEIELLNRKIEKLRIKSKYYVKLAYQIPDCSANTVFAYALSQLQEKNHDMEHMSEEGKSCVRRDVTNSLEKVLRLNPDHHHAGMMLADALRISRPDIPVKDLLQYLTADGNNCLYHRFVYLLLANRWTEAAKVAATLKSRDLRGEDKYISDRLNMFFDWLKQLDNN